MTEKLAAWVKAKAAELCAQVTNLEDVSGLFVDRWAAGLREEMESLFPECKHCYTELSAAIGARMREIEGPTPEDATPLTQEELAAGTATVERFRALQIAHGLPDYFGPPEPAEADLKAHADEYRADLKKLEERGIILDARKP